MKEGARICSESGRGAIWADFANTCHKESGFGEAVGPLRNPRTSGSSLNQTIDAWRLFK
jgi:hypothetical protein